MPDADVIAGICQRIVRHQSAERRVERQLLLLDQFRNHHGGEHSAHRREHERRVRRVRTAPPPIRQAVSPTHERLAVVRQENRARKMVVHRKRRNESIHVCRQVSLWRRKGMEQAPTSARVNAPAIRTMSRFRPENRVLQLIARDVNSRPSVLRASVTYRYLAQSLNLSKPLVERVPTRENAAHHFPLPAAKSYACRTVGGNGNRAGCGTHVTVSYRAPRERRDCLPLPDCLLHASHRTLSSSRPG